VHGSIGISEQNCGFIVALQSSPKRGTNLLSHFRTQRMSHAALRHFFAQSALEVTVMADEGLTKLERDIAIIEQTLHAMIQIDPTVAQLHVDCYEQSTEHATVMR